VALPRTDKPLFELKIPSTNKVVLFRPFLVKEEKLLLMAQQSEQEKDLILAVKQIIQNCAQDVDFDINSLATFDLEYMFLKLRARSVNNIIDVSYQDLEDDKIYKFEIDLDEVDIIYSDSSTNKIEIDNENGIIMKYPSVTILDNLPETTDTIELVDYLIKTCVDQIYDSETVYYAKDHTLAELTDYLDNLDTNTYGKIRDFFYNLPKMFYKIEYENSLGTKRTIKFETLSDFFTWR
jgi:hypothetical protein